METQLDSSFYRWQRANIPRSSYLVLCCKIGSVLPGKKTIPDQISENKQPYYKALEAADEASRQGLLDLTKTEEMLSIMLARQLYAVHTDATGAPQTDHDGL